MFCLTVEVLTCKHNNLAVCNWFVNMQTWYMSTQLNTCQMKQNLHRFLFHPCYSSSFFSMRNNGTHFEVFKSSYLFLKEEISQETCRCIETDWKE